MAKKKSKLNILRIIIQIIFFGFIALTVLNHNLEDFDIKPIIPNGPSIHAICPFGGVATLPALIMGDKFVKHIHESNIVLFIALIIIGIVFGAIFCGYICPFGSIQEWIGKLGKKIFKKKYNNWYSSKIHRILSFGRWFLLIMVLIQTTQTGLLMFTNMDPYYALFNFYTGEVVPLAFAILGVVLIGSLFVERPWCKYLCPLGIINGLLSKISIFKIRRNKNTCINCKKCTTVCPEHIEVHTSKAISVSQCNRCLKCVDICPVDNTLNFATYSNMGGENNNENK